MIIPFVLIAFASVRCLVVLANLLTRQWLRPNQVDGSPRVSVLIPARNEENNIAALLTDLISIHNHALENQVSVIGEIIVYNDQSTDNTVQEVQGVKDPDGVIRLMDGDPLPEGWLGKNYACHRMASEAKGDWLLFLDADVKVSSGLIRDAVGYAQLKQVRLLSLFPRQIMISRGEWMVVPLMNWILTSLLPLILIRTCRWTSFAAANGQFMLFDASIYRRFQWHSLVKSDPVEDIRISRLMKKKRFRTATLLSGGQIQCRMYENYDLAMNGFSKNVGQFFGNSLVWMLLFVFLTSLLPLSLIPLSFLLPSALLPCALYLLLVTCIRVTVSLISRQNVFLNLLFWLPQQFVLLILVWKSIRFRLGRKVEWKGRRVSNQSFLLL